MNIGIHVEYDTFFAIIFMLSSTLVCKFINNESRSVSSPSRTHSNAACILVRMACDYYCNLCS
jgi:hypothetical protein